MSKISIKELGRRVLVSAISISIVGVFVYFSQNEFFKPVFALLIALIASVGVYEYIKLVEHKQVFLKTNWMIFACFLQIFSFYLYSQIIGFKLFPTISFFFIVFVSFLSRFNKIEGACSYVAFSTLGILYIVIPMGLIFPILYFRDTHGVFWLLYLIAVTKISDVGAYFGGKLFGRHKLAERISPNKTIEGALAGLLFSMAVSYLFYFISNQSSNFSLKLNPGIFLILGASLGVLGQIGDLAESLLKRDARIKDSNTLPGFGGILDLVDSLLFNIPFFFFFLEVVI